MATSGRVLVAPKARNVIAQGNALGKGHSNSGSAEGAKYKFRLKTLRSSLRLFHFAPSALQISSGSPPGPLAQAATFRAFGAENQGFSHSLYRFVFDDPRTRSL